MNRSFLFFVLGSMIMVHSVAPVLAYPIDGYARTGIRRLERLNLIARGELKGTPLVEGALKLSHEIHLNLTRIWGDSLMFPLIPDPSLQAKVEALFPNRDESYSVAILDMSPDRHFRYAAHQADRSFSPGSVGKLAVVAGLFTELKRLYPDDIQKRQELLVNRMVNADHWIRYDDHTVPVYNPENRTYRSRVIVEGDVFSLYEWTDHMMSASANAAANIVWKEVILMRVFGEKYPPSYEEETAFFNDISKADLQKLAISVVNDPLQKAGINRDEFQLGSLFTAYGKSLIPSGGSWGSPIAMLKYLIALEQGRLVDEWSSLEIKQLMYMTARRIRYASAPRLSSSAVFFKSGSYYRCKSEPGFSCEKYRGNVENVMNSVVIVEHPDGRMYCVALMSNILRKNSAVEHQTLATYIDRILSK